MSDKKTHIEEEWWTPDQVELANDLSRIWEKKILVPRWDILFRLKEVER